MSNIFRSVTIILTLLILGSACPFTQCLNAVLGETEFVDIDIEVPCEKKEVEDDYDKQLMCCQQVSAYSYTARISVQSISFLRDIPPVIPVISPPPESFT